MECEELTPSHSEYLEVIKNSGKLLMALINDILDLSKIEAGKMSIAASPTEVADIAAKVENLTSFYE